MTRFFQHPGFDGDIRSALGAAAYGLTEAGAVLAVAGRIRDGDLDGWFDEWTAEAARLAEAAQAAEAAGRRQSARELWLRASRCHAMAQFYALGTRDPGRSAPSFAASRDALDRAVALWPSPAAKVAIPCEGHALQGYWIDPEAGSGHRPLAIFNNGSDGLAVDMLSFGAIAALERGWRVLIFDGPGQGAALHDDGLPFRFDWEAVIRPVVDFALARPGVDPARVALIGLSQGGYMVPRAAAFEPRLAAIVADPGVTRVWTSWFDNLPPEMAALFDRGDRATFDAWMAEAAKEPTPPEMAFQIAKRAEPYRLTDFWDLLTEVRRYDLTGVTGLIRCPTLVTAPEGEAFWPGQSQELHDALTCPKALIPFTAAEGADGHCEPMAPRLRAQRIFDWLEATLGP